jgi:signal transduction histidine kinase
VIERPAAIRPELDAEAVALGRRGVAVERKAPGNMRLRAVPVRSPRTRELLGSIVVGTSTAATARLREYVLLGSIVFACSVLAAAALTIDRALRAALRPVTQMTSSAEEWGAHDLDRRFNLGEPRDELTGLAATLDHLLARIAASRRHEQRFASEVAHELRTPLAALRGRAELALASSGDASDALTSVISQADRLDGAIEALMAVARAELDPGAGVTDVAEVAHSFDDVLVDAPPALPRAEGEPEVVRSALAPLVDNARKHGGAGVTLELRVVDSAVEIRVRDGGPGPDPALGDSIFEPGVRGTRNGNGTGLGLPLARRLARSCGGDVVVADGPERYLVLRLPQMSA